MLTVQGAAAQQPARGRSAGAGRGGHRAHEPLADRGADGGDRHRGGARPAGRRRRRCGLAAGDDDAATELLGTVATRVLGGLGYTLYAAEADTVRQAAVDLNWTQKVLAVDLVYPDVGRTLGIWRSWIERDLAVTALIEITEADSGRMLLNDRIVRSFGDRVPDDDFAAVNSGTYDFTSADTQESGWQSRIEAIVVVGTLAGLIAIYFSNTSD